MKILAPIDNVAEVEEVIKAGADALYCGVLWEDWAKKYTLAGVNRRPALVCNFKSFEHLKEAVTIARTHRVPVQLAINEHYYTQEQYPLLLEYTKRALDAGIESLILADPAFVLALREENINVPVHVSTGITILNSEAAKFFQDLGVKGVILERHLTIAEIREMMKNLSGIETGVFIFNSRCPNVDGLCTFDHIQTTDSSYNNACMLPYSVSLASAAPAGEKQAAAALERQRIWTRFHMDDVPCGACALYDFQEMGIDSVKIVGRGNKSKRKITDVKFLRMLLTYLKDKTVSRTEYIAKTQAFYNYVYKLPCRTVMCYFPELRDTREDAV